MPQGRPSTGGSCRQTRLHCRLWAAGSVFNMCVLVLLCGGAALVAGNSPIPEPNVQYMAGDVGIILSSPHDGDTRLYDIPTRRNGCNDGGSRSCYYGNECRNPTTDCGVVLKNDLRTRHLTLLLREKLCALLGNCPHTIINNVHRSKLDANRPKEEAAQDDPTAETAWDFYQNSLTQAKKAIQGRGLLLEIHGHGHDLQRTELGYMVIKSRLNGKQGKKPVARYSSINKLAQVQQAKGISFEAVLRGSHSLGKYLNDEGCRAVPSPQEPAPGNNNKYFPGGYNIKQHGSRYAGDIDAIQIEVSSWQRSTANLTDYSDALASAIARYWVDNYDGKLP